MKWQLIDVHGEVDDTKDSNYATHGCWPHGDEVRVCNASSGPLFVTHAPCKISTTDRMATTISPGSSGTIDAAPPAPWTHRMAHCLEQVATCTTSIVGIIDAPSDLHIRAAIESMPGFQETFACIRKDSNKFLILTGKATPQYLTVADGNGCHYSDKPWRSLVSRGMWDWTVETPAPDGCRTLQTALARLLGTCEACPVQRKVHLTYPDGVTVPACAAEYIKYGPQIDTNSARFSTTRGITVNATGPGPISATVIAETEHHHSPEAEHMRQLRTMLTSTDPGEVGSAYFILGQTTLEEPMASIVTAAMQTVANHLHPVRTLRAPPVLRQASYVGKATAAHSAWR